jgi:hypothetical protein
LESFVASFPETGAKWQVFTIGAESPRWRNDDKELFFRADGVEGIMSAAVDGSGPSFDVAQIRTLFPASLGLGHEGMIFVPTRDGQRFLVMTTGAQGLAPLIEVENWTAAFNKR